MWVERSWSVASPSEGNSFRVCDIMTLAERVTEEVVRLTKDPLAQLPGVPW